MGISGWLGRDNLTLSLVGDWVGYLLPLLLVFHLSRRKGFWSSVGVGKRGLLSGLTWLFALFLLFSFLLGIYGEAVARLVGEDPGEEVFDRMREQFPSWYFAYFALASFFPVALTEEVVFRGFLLREFLPLGVARAVLLSSAMHSLSHLWYLELGLSGLTMFGSAFLFFLWMGTVYAKTGNLLPPILMHGLNNASLSLRFFWGEEATSALSTLLLFLGWFSLLHLLLSRRVRRERPRGGGREERRAPGREGIKRMMERLDTFRREGKLSEEEWRRLKEVYRERLRELEREEGG
jgi:membrane protease YdiL (CAAX protease family)